MVDQIHFDASLLSATDLADFDRSTARLPGLYRERSIAASDFRNFMFHLGYDRQIGWAGPGSQDTDVQIGRELYVNPRLPGDLQFNVRPNEDGQLDTAIVAEIVARLQAFGVT